MASPLNKEELDALLKDLQDPEEARPERISNRSRFRYFSCELEREFGALSSGGVWSMMSSFHFSEEQL